MTAKPITPSEVNKKKVELLPDAVLEAFNELIAENWDGVSSTVLQKTVVERIVSKGYSSDQVFDNHWLDVEDVYRGAGWKVEYDKPGYCESYDAYFVFRKKR